MEKKTKGSVAEQKVILALIEKNIVVSIPIGNNDAYDLIADVNGRLYRIQVKSAYLSNKGRIESAGSRRSLTNSRTIKHRWYKKEDFEVAVIVYENDFYLIPSEIFCSFKSGLNFSSKRTKSMKYDLSVYLNDWTILH